MSIMLYLVPCEMLPSAVHEVALVFCCHSYLAMNETLSDQIGISVRRQVFLHLSHKHAAAAHYYYCKLCNM